MMDLRKPSQEEGRGRAREGKKFVAECRVVSVRISHGNNFHGKTENE